MLEDSYNLYEAYHLNTLAENAAYRDTGSLSRQAGRLASNSCATAPV